MTNNLFVGGFPYETTEAELAKFFASCGTVSRVKILTERETGRSRGIGFVLMSTEAEAAAAIAKLNDTMLGERKIFVTEAKPPEKREGGPADKPGFVERRSGLDRRRQPSGPAGAGAGERRWDKKPGGFGGEKKWDKKPGGFGGEKKWDKKPGGFGGEKKWDKKPGGLEGGKKRFFKPGGFGVKRGGYPKRGGRRD